MVRAAAQTLSVVHSDDPLLLARAAYHLGNRHIPVQLGAGLARLRARPRARRHGRATWGWPSTRAWRRSSPRPAATAGTLAPEAGHGHDRRTTAITHARHHDH